MISTYEDLCDLVREKLGDADVPGGDVFTNDDLLLSFQSAWRELIGMMVQDQIPAEKRQGFHNLGANTPILAPIQAGITDLGEPSLLEERVPGVVLAIANIQSGPGGAIQITTQVPHGLTAPKEVFVSDVLGLVGVNGRWFEAVMDTTNLLLTGSIFPTQQTVANSGYVANTGSLTTSSGQRWTEVRLVETLTDRDPDTILRECIWQGDVYEFVGATQTVQLRITYFSSGDPPSSGTLIYDGIIEPLACRTAAIAAYAHGRSGDEADRLDVEARGELRDGSGGAYYRFLQPKVRQMQQSPIRRPIAPPAHLEDIYDPFY